MLLLLTGPFIWAGWGNPVQIPTSNAACWARLNSGRMWKLCLLLLARFCSFLDIKFELLSFQSPSQHLNGNVSARFTGLGPNELDIKYCSEKLSHSCLTFAMIRLPQINAANSGVSEVQTIRDEDLSKSWCLRLTHCSSATSVFCGGIRACIQWCFGMAWSSQLMY